MLAVSSPQSEEYNDVYNIATLFDELTDVLKEAGIDIKGLFMKADTGFNTEDFR